MAEGLEIAMAALCRQLEASAARAPTHPSAKQSNANASSKANLVLPCTAPTSALSSFSSTTNAAISSSPAGHHWVLEDPLYTLESLTPIDKRLISVYGDTVHHDDGTHMSGGIDDDKVWQSRWNSLTALPCQQYDVPPSKVGHCFVELLATQINGVTECKWNSNHFIVFPILILQCLKGTKASHNICRCIDHQLDLWEQGKFDQLCEDTVATCQRQILANQKAVRWLTGHEKGGLLQPNNKCSKTGLPVATVLQSKHPEPVVPELQALKEFPNVHAFVNVDVTGGVIEKVARHLSGAAGPGGVDWIANSFPPWAAIRAYVAGHLIGLDKCPGVRPVGVGEALQCLAGKA
eukprot:3394045-Ditylum_brightwellii.AAC.1